MVRAPGLNAPLKAIAAFCESVLLDAGFADEAYARYAVEAMYVTTNLATFKAIVKMYPHIPQETILRDLVASQPSQEGKMVRRSQGRWVLRTSHRTGEPRSVRPANAHTCRQTVCR